MLKKTNDVVSLNWRRCLAVEYPNDDWLGWAKENVPATKLHAR